MNTIKDISDHGGHISIDDVADGASGPAHGEPAPEHLMPYGAAAKAIFIRANGLTAYNRRFRYGRRAI